MGPDISANDDRIVDALSDNLHRLFFHDHHGLTDSERNAAARKAISIAVDQSGAAIIDAALSKLHPQLRSKVAFARDDKATV